MLDVKFKVKINNQMFVVSFTQKAIMFHFQLNLSQYLQRTPSRVAFSYLYCMKITLGCKEFCMMETFLIRLETTIKRGGKMTSSVLLDRDLSLGVRRPLLLP